MKDKFNSFETVIPNAMQKLHLVITLMCVIIIQGCTLDSDTGVDRSRFTFKTGDDTEIFFKNVRQSDYDLEVNTAAKFNVFRHEERILTDTLPWIYPAIVINYLQDEAYILLEPSPKLADADVWEVVIGPEADTLRLETPNRENNLEFATRIFESLREGKSIRIRSGNEFVPFLEQPDASEAFRITMSDYYRLVRVF
jgi:hypothetical protein